MKFFYKVLLIVVAINLFIPAAYIFSKNNKFYISEKSLKYMEQKYGIFAKRRMEALLNLMNSLKNVKDEMTILTKVNDFFNRVPYKTDMQVWGVKDYWATRMEFLGKDAGDCEDYVIAKYFTLIQLGIPKEKLFFTYAKSKIYKTAHMVLTYFPTPKSIPLVLGNYNRKILPATKRKDLIPIANFRGDEIYLAKQRGLGKQVPPGRKVSKKWNDMINRIRSIEQ